MNPENNVFERLARAATLQEKNKKVMEDKSWREEFEKNQNFEVGRRVAR